MAPKRRLARPAAAPKAVAKAKAKGVARPKLRAGPKRGARKKPAAEVKEDPKVFSHFEKVPVHQVSMEELLQGGLLRIQGVYWKEDAEVAGRVRSVKTQEQEMWAHLEVQGTKNEHVLKYPIDKVRQLRVN